MYQIVKGDSDVELSDDERDEGFTPGREEGQEEGGERCRRLHEHTDTDRETDRDELERHGPLWAKSSTYVLFLVEP